MGATSVRDGPRLSAERSTIAKLGHGCEAGERAGFVGEEPGTNQGSHFCVQASARADPEAGLLPPGAQPAQECAAASGVAATGGARGEDGAAEGSN